jgi:hypothetical protein
MFCVFILNIGEPKYNVSCMVLFVFQVLGSYRPETLNIEKNQDGPILLAQIN